MNKNNIDPAVMVFFLQVVLFIYLTVYQFIHIDMTPARVAVNCYPVSILLVLAGFAYIFFAIKKVLKKTTPKDNTVND